MLPSKVFSAALSGLDAQIIEVEVDTSYGLRSFNIVGLPDKAVEESRERVGAAIKSVGFAPPQRQPLRVLVNLAPADLKKEGSLYDLPIALAYLAATNQLRGNFENKIIIGELALDGRLRAVKGVLSVALLAKEGNWSEIILPKANAHEAALVKNIRVTGAENIKEVIDHIEKRKEIEPSETDIGDLLRSPNYSLDLNCIKGQEYAKRALEIAAAGGHNLLMTGPPGTGKTLLAKSIPSLLPSLTIEESLEITKIYSAAGLLRPEKPIISARPFRSPHHTASEPALIGGGNPPRPGEITLAHRGVLFLDEFPEFHRDVLESLRQPLEDGHISVLRARQTLDFPARFILVAAANPCPCGFLNDPEKECRCMSSQVAKYRRKLSGPLVDRFDLFAEVPQVKYEKLIAPEGKSLSKEVRERIENAREIQTQRLRPSRKTGEAVLVNSEMSLPQIKEHCEVDIKSQDLLRNFVNSGKLSARGYHRILKVARTIADLESNKNISYRHTAEALMYRTKDI